MIHTLDKAAVRSAFAAAGDYDRAAALQREVATALARQIAALDIPGSPDILEIGCGTGFLGRTVAACRPNARWLFTDLAPAMVARTRETSSQLGNFVAMDGERPCIAEGPRFHLICSSLAVQWFTDPATSFAALAGLLKPGGYLAFSTLGAGSFREWRALLAAHDLTAGTPHYPDAAGWAAALPPLGTATVTEEDRVVNYPDPQQFLRDLKQIGAGTPRRDHRPVSAGHLRRALRGIAGPFATTYHVVSITYRHGTGTPS